MKTPHQTRYSLSVAWRTIAFPVVIEPDHLAAVRHANEQRQFAALKRWTPTASLKKAK